MKIYTHHHENLNCLKIKAQPPVIIKISTVHDKSQPVIMKTSTVYDEMSNCNISRPFISGLFILKSRLLVEMAFNRYRMENEHPQLMDISSSGLHIIQGAFKTGAKSTDWAVEERF